MTQSSHADVSAVFGGPFGLTHDGSDPILDDASLLHMAGSSGLSGDYQGRDSICELLNRMVELTADTLRFSLPQVLVANDQTVVLRRHVDAIRQGRQLDSDLLCVLSVDVHTVREMWVYHLDQTYVDEFWAVHRVHR